MGVHYAWRNLYHSQRSVISTRYWRTNGQQVPRNGLEKLAAGAGASRRCAAELLLLQLGHRQQGVECSARLPRDLRHRVLQGSRKRVSATARLLMRMG